MDQLIPVINKLHDVFNCVGLNSFELPLPQIAVVGSQSSGKSSVLEALVGRDFLPRGTGIVTRRPLVLQMVNVPARTKDSQAEEWGEFLHLPQQKFYNFDKIRQEIIDTTNQETGGEEGKVISSRPINLKIYSPSVLNLTLVDLPGITKVPVGAQPEDIEEQINFLIMEYIMHPHCIILAVTAANTDMANSDALKMARQVDPNGERTVGVLTKLDLMDKGTHAMDILLGKVVPLQLGITGVVCRGQQAIDTNVGLKESREAEASFFANHPQYSSIKGRLGTAHLAAMLNKILLRHIQSTLPDLRARVRTMLTDAETTIAQLGGPPADDVDKAGLLLQILTKFAATYVSYIDGTAGSLTTQELAGGARISYIFHNVFEHLLADFGQQAGPSQADIRTAIRNAAGVKPALFIPDTCFELLVKTQMARLKEPALRCLQLVHDEMLHIVGQCKLKELSRYSGLWEAVSNTVQEMVRERHTPAARLIGDILQMELAYINTNHPDFIGVAQALEEMEDRGHEGDSHTAEEKREGSDKEKEAQDLAASQLSSLRHSSDRLSQETRLIGRLLESYLGIVLKRVQDSVPKAIMLQLVNHVRDHLQSTLVAKLYTAECMETLLHESPAIVKQRKEAREVLETLTRASAIINSLGDDIAVH